MKDREFLQWIYDRLMNRHGENPNYDYMHRLREIIEGTPENQRIRRVYSGEVVRTDPKITD